MSKDPLLRLPPEIVSKLRKGEINIEPRIFGTTIKGITVDGLVTDNGNILNFSKKIKEMYYFAPDVSESFISGVSILPSDSPEKGTSVTLQLKNKGYCSYMVDSPPVALNKDLNSESTVRDIFISALKEGDTKLKVGDYVIFKDWDGKKLVNIIDQTTGSASGMIKSFPCIGYVDSVITPSVVNVATQYNNYHYPNDIFKVVHKSVLERIFQDTDVSKLATKPPFPNPDERTIGELYEMYGTIPSPAIGSFGRGILSTTSVASDLSVTSNSSVTGRYRI